jgi:hypothetical protein
MLGQQGSWLGATNTGGTHSHNVTIQVPNRNVLAEVALLKIYVLGEDFWYSEVGISQVVSNGGVENFDPPKYVISRKGVTSITFHVAVYKSSTRGRWMINFWS